MGKEKMFVCNVDKDGRQIGDGEWVDASEAITYKVNGLEKIKLNVERILKFNESLVISTLDEKKALCLWASNKIITIALFIDWRKELNEEKTIRKYFSNLSIIPYKDYLAGNGNVSDATRCIYYHIDQKISHVVEICSDILTKIYRVNIKDGLKFKKW